MHVTCRIIQTYCAIFHNTAERRVYTKPHIFHWWLLFMNVKSLDGRTTKGEREEGKEADWKEERFHPCELNPETGERKRVYPYPLWLNN